MSWTTPTIASSNELDVPFGAGAGGSPDATGWPGEPLVGALGPPFETRYVATAPPEIPPTRTAASRSARMPGPDERGDRGAGEGGSVTPWATAAAVVQVQSQERPACAAEPSGEPPPARPSVPPPYHAPRGRRARRARSPPPTNR